MNKIDLKKSEELYLSHPLTGSLHYNSSIKIKLFSPYCKNDAVEDFYVLKDVLCDCDKGVATFHNPDVAGSEFEKICQKCKGVGYTTEKVLLKDIVSY